MVNFEQPIEWKILITAFFCILTICRANQLTGFYMMETLVVKGLRILKTPHKRYWYCFLQHIPNWSFSSKHKYIQQISMQIWYDNMHFGLKKRQKFYSRLAFVCIICVHYSCIYFAAVSQLCVYFAAVYCLCLYFSVLYYHCAYFVVLHIFFGLCYFTINDPTIHHSWINCLSLHPMNIVIGGYNLHLIEKLKCFNG